MMRVALTESAFAPEAEIDVLTSGRCDFGALTSFVGFCRGEDGAVSALELQHYPGFTEAQIARFAASVGERHGLLGGVIIHRIGVVAPGEPIVLVAALSRHRAEGFQAVEEIMDYLKTDAPLWKRELSAEGARWIEPTEADRRRSAERHQGRAP